MDKAKKKSAFSYLFEWAKPHKAGYICSVVLAILSVACSIVPYICVGEIITNLLAGEKSMSVFGMWVGIAFAGWIGNIIFHNISTTVSHKNTFKVIAETRQRMCNKLAKIPMGQVLGRSSGETKNLIIEKVDSIEPTLAHIVPELTSKLLVPFAIIIYLFVLDWRLALTSLVTFPIAFVCMGLVQKSYAKKYAHYAKSNKELNSVSVEYINGIEVIKAFNHSASSYGKFTNAAKVAARSAIDWMKDCLTYMSVASIVLPAVMICTLPVGTAFYMQGSLDLSTFIMVIILAFGIVPPLISAGSFVDDFAKVGTTVGDIASILEEEDLIRPEKEVKINNYEIKADDVHFAYKEKEVLHGINFDIKQGSVNAFVGPSGSGKSTIAKLIASMWDVNDGNIMIGDKNIKDIPLEQLNNIIAYVSQDNYLFDDTIRNNIRMGNLNATDKEVEDIAKASGCHEFIMNLDNGYETLVGSAGGHLSGGERQRISIARAMLKNAPIIILDEATAYTDPENEATIQKAISKLIKGKTLIVIAHRLSTITDSDQIIVVKDGNIQASGKHEELLENCKLYNNMWKAHIDAKDSKEVA